MIYYFDLAGKLQGSADLATFSKMVGKPIKTVEACLKGFRGYSYLGGYLLSASPTITLVSAIQAERMLSKWVINDLPARIKVLQRRYTSFQEDLVSEVLMYMFRAIKRPQGINDFAPLFDWKYKLVLSRHISKGNARVIPIADVEICHLLGTFSDTTTDCTMQDEISEIKGYLSSLLTEEHVAIFIACLPHLEYNGGRPTYSLRKVSRNCTHPTITNRLRGKGIIISDIIGRALDILFP